MAEAIEAVVLENGVTPNRNVEDPPDRTHSLNKCFIKLSKEDSQKAKEAFRLPESLRVGVTTGSNVTPSNEVSRTYPQASRANQNASRASILNTPPPSPRLTPILRNNSEADEGNTQVPPNIPQEFEDSHMEEVSQGDNPNPNTLTDTDNERGEVRNPNS